MRFDTPKEDQLTLPGVRTPPAVFAVALDVDSSADEKVLESALHQLVDEDSSLQIMKDDDTGETLLAGMGELHLEVSIDRMQRKLPFVVHMSHPRVSYRETITQAVDHIQVLDTTVGSSRLVGTLRIRLRPQEDPTQENKIFIEGDTFEVEKTEAIRQGVLAGLGRGPALGVSVTGVEVQVTAVEGSNCESGDAGLRACASKGVQSALQKAESVVMEPFMRVEALVPEESVGDVVSELTHPTRRRGIIEAVSIHGTADESKADGTRLITALVPVEGMIGWASKMRSITKGRGSLQATFFEYRRVDHRTQARIVEKL